MKTIAILVLSLSLASCIANTVLADALEEELARTYADFYKAVSSGDQKLCEQSTSRYRSSQCGYLEVSPLPDEAPTPDMIKRIAAACDGGRCYLLIEYRGDKRALFFRREGKKFRYEEDLPPPTELEQRLMPRPLSSEGQQYEYTGAISSLGHTAVMVCLPEEGRREETSCEDGNHIYFELWPFDEASTHKVRGELLSFPLVQRRLFALARICRNGECQSTSRLKVKLTNKGAAPKGTLILPVGGKEVEIRFSTSGLMGVDRCGG